MNININVKKVEEKELEKRFLEKVQKIQDEIVGSETYGDYIEFFDEDGVVLLTAKIEDNNQVHFEFKVPDEDPENNIFDMHFSGNLEEMIGINK